MGVISDFPVSNPDGGSVIMSSGMGTQVGRSMMLIGNTSASAVYPSANQAQYVPFVVEHTVTAYQMGVYNGTVVSGNISLGLYNQHGTRLVVSANTAQAGTSAPQKVDITDTVLTPGTYYMALSCDNVTATFFRNTQAFQLSIAHGLKVQATAYPLPATATFALPSVSNVPTFWVQLHPTIL